MRTAENVAAVHRWTACLNAHDAETGARELTEDHIAHLPGMPGPIMGAEAWQSYSRAWFSAFPDIHIEVVDEVAAGDRVAGRWLVTGTHRGEFNGIPATGKKVSTTGMNIFRVENGKLAEEWSVLDQMTMMQQLGLMPAPGG